MTTVTVPNFLSIKITLNSLKIWKIFSEIALVVISQSQASPSIIKLQIQPPTTKRHISNFPIYFIYITKTAKFYI